MHSEAAKAAGTGVLAYAQRIASVALQRPRGEKKLTTAAPGET